MRNLPRCWTLSLSFLLGFAAIAPPASAQAKLAADRSDEIAPFAELTDVNPDWGPTDNIGYTVGLDYTHFIRSIIRPSLEIRITSANGSSVNERVYSGGLKLATSIRGIQPYAIFLLGHGNIDFVHPDGAYRGDNSIVSSLGAGVDLGITEAIRLRLEFTHQHWNFDPNTLTPVTLSVGISYALPFRRGR
jgi:hypothetical protein